MFKINSNLIVRLQAAASIAILLIIYQHIALAGSNNINTNERPANNLSAPAATNL